MKTKKAIFFSTDALIALLIIFLSILIIYPIIKYSDYKTNLNEDVLTVLSSLKVGEVNNSYIQNLISLKEITDLNKSILEQIGDFYVTNLTRAKEMTKSILLTLNTTENIGVWYGEDLLASVNSSPYETATDIEVERQIISGIEKGKSSKGFVSKAWLRKVSKKKNILFIKGDLMCGGWKSYSWGDYCGTSEATAVYNVNFPTNATIKNAFWLIEGAWTPQFSRAYVNGVEVYSGSVDHYTNVDITSFLHPGNNTATLYGAIGVEDGASHIIVEYETPDMQTYHSQTKFYLNKLTATSVLHQEKSIILPSDISLINATINTTSDVTLSFRKGIKSFEIGKKSPVNNIVTFSDAEIKNALNSNGISYSDLNSEYFFLTLDIGKDTPGQVITLEGESFFYINSSKIIMPYGTIDITQEIPLTNSSNHVVHTFYRNLEWQFHLPISSTPILADWQFGWFIELGVSEQKVTANGIVLYDSPPDAFIPAFSRFGYSPSRAQGVFQEGQNNFTLDFGNTYSVSNESSYGHLIYFIKSYVNYGDAKEKAQGGTRVLEFEDGSVQTFRVGNFSDVWDPDVDAVDDAVERLFSQLDADKDNKLDLVFNADSFSIESMDISGVPYIWNTEVQARRWI